MCFLKTFPPSRILCRYTAYPLLLVLLCASILVSHSPSRAASNAQQATTSLPASKKISLTPAEQQFLQSHPVLRVGHSSTFEPMMIRDSSGQLTGTIPDFYTQVAQRLGVKVEFIDEKWQQLIGRTQQGDIDIIGQMNEAVAQDKGLLTTTIPFANLITVFSRNDSNIKINSDNDIKNLRVAYHQDVLLIDQYLKSHEETLTLIKTHSPLEAFKHVLVGKADIMIGFNANSYLLSKYFIPEISPIYVLNNLNTTAAAAIHPNKKQLVSILRKAFGSFSQQELRAIINKWGWSPRLQQEEIQLTADELSFLEKRPYLTVANLTDFVPFNFIENGQPAGYSIDYMNIVGDVLNMDIHFISGPWMVLLEKLKTGELDIIPHIAHTEERDKFVDYTDFNHITYHSGFAVRTSEHVHSLKDLSGKTVAVMENGFLHKHLIDHHPDIPLVLVNTSSKAIELVARNKAFAAVGSLPYLNYYIKKEWHTNLTTIAVDEPDEPGRTLMPMGVSKENNILTSILEKAEAAIPQKTITELQEKWIRGYLNERKAFSFTKAEEKFKERHPVVRFRIRSDRPPFEFTNNGEPAGIAVDYLTAITKKVGITAQFIIDDRPYHDAITVVNGKRDKFDTLAFTVKNEDRAKILSFGDTYLSYPMMIIAHQNSPYIGEMSDLQSKTVAIEIDYLTNKWLKRDYPKIDIVPANSTLAALQMVNDEKVDAYVGNLAVANYMINHRQMDNLKIVAPSDYGRVKFNFVAPQKWPELVSLLNKGYRALNAQEQNLLNQRWFSVQIVEKTNYTLLWQILLFGAFFFIFIIWWNHVLRAQKSKTDLANAKLHEIQLLLKAKNEELEVLSQTDKLTSLYNRFKLDKVLQAEYERSLRYGRPFGVIMIDIDNFKDVNDTFGHQVGDAVLNEVAQILLNNSRNTDTVGRWGGEEFLVICPHTEKEGLLALATNLREKIAAVSFDTVGHKTASFGVTLYQKDSSVANILSRADMALYKSKENGKNQVSFV